MAAPAVAPPAATAAKSGPFTEGQKVKLVSLASNKAGMLCQLSWSNFFVIPVLVSVAQVKPSVVAATGDDTWTVHVAADGNICCFGMVFLLIWLSYRSFHLIRRRAILQASRSQARQGGQGEEG